jgi:hypothetical protein
VTYQVTLADGVPDIVLPNGLRVQGGAVVVLSDGEYSRITDASSAILFSSVTYLGGGAGNAVSSFNGRTGNVEPASGDYTVSEVTGAAPLASPVFTGTPAGPTAAAGTSTTQLATTAFATTALALKSNIASPTFTGTPAAPTATAGTSTTQLATTAFATGAVATETTRAETAEALKAPLASPAFTGQVSATTVGDGYSVAEGSSGKQGVVTLAAGSATVDTASVTANSRIFLTVQSLGTITAPAAVAVTARTAGTSFTITSALGTDTSVVAYEIFEPAA